MATWGTLTTAQRDDVVARHEAGESWSKISIAYNITTFSSFSRHARSHAAKKRQARGQLSATKWVEKAEVVESPEMEAPPEPEGNPILIRRISELTRELEKNQDYRQLIVESVIEYCPRLPAILPPPKQRPAKKYDNETAMLDLSDIHAGEVVRAEDVGGLNSYSWDVLTKRVHALREKVLTCAGIMRASIPINRLVINALGDWVTGEDIFIGQGREIDRILVDQLFDFAALFTNEFLVPVLREFREVWMYGVFGNHARVGHRGTHHPRTNFDYILYRTIATNLSRTEHFRAFVSESSFLGYHLPDQPAWKHLLAHGDKFRGWMGIPFYGLDRFTARMIGLTQVTWNYVHVGHHHSNAAIDFPGGEKLLNGSWVGGDMFSIGELQAAGTPKQNFYGIHPRQGITWEYPIRFERLQPLTPDDKGLYTPVAELQPVIEDVKLVKGKGKVFQREDIAE